MKISELLEEQGHPQLPILLRTDRFVKEAAKLLDASLEDKLAKFLKKKLESPLVLIGTLDRVGTYELKGWNHYHLRYGNTVLIHYQATADHILLASVTDHRAVDGGTYEVQNLAEYLKNIDLKSLQSQPSAPLDELTKSQVMSAQDIIYELATHELERDHVQELAQSGSLDQIKDYFEILGLPLNSQAVKRYQQIASQALSTIPPPQ